MLAWYFTIVYKHPTTDSVWAYGFKFGWVVLIRIDSHDVGSHSKKPIHVFSADSQRVSSWMNRSVKHQIHNTINATHLQIKLEFIFMIIFNGVYPGHCLICLKENTYDHRVVCVLHHNHIPLARNVVGREFEVQYHLYNCSDNAMETHQKHLCSRTTENMRMTTNRIPNSFFSRLEEVC